MELEPLTLISGLDLTFKLLHLQRHLLVVDCHGFFLIQESLKFTVNSMSCDRNWKAKVVSLSVAWAHSLQQLVVLLALLGCLDSVVHLRLQARIVVQCYSSLV